MVGCADNFHVDFDKASWPAGDYTLEVELDGAKTTCTVTLPFKGCDNLAQCSGDTTSVLPGVSGCALAESEHKLSGIILVDKQPAKVKVDVSFGGASIGSAEYTPTYTTSRPNGPDCEPVCTTAPGQKLTLK